MHNSVVMAIFLPTDFLQGGIILCFLAPLQGKNISYSTHGDSIVMVSSEAFQDLIIQSFDVRDAL